MMPVGWLPALTPTPLRLWSLAEWRQYAGARGVAEVKPLQEPLYYFLMFDKLWNIEYAALTCSRPGCGRVAKVHGVMVRHYPRRQDLCACCATNAAKRGLLPPDWIPHGLPRRHWGRALRERGSVMPAA